MTAKGIITVKEFIEILQEQDPDRIVVMSCDSEGNGFSPLYEVVGDTMYEPETSYSGQIGDHGQPALVLYPTN